MAQEQFLVVLLMMKETMILQKDIILRSYLLSRKQKIYLTLKKDSDEIVNSSFLNKLNLKEAKVLLQVKLSRKK